MQVLVFKYFLKSQAISAKLCKNCVAAPAGSEGRFQGHDSSGQNAYETIDIEHLRSALS